MQQESTTTLSYSTESNPPIVFVLKSLTWLILIKSSWELLTGFVTIFLPTVSMDPWRHLRWWTLISTVVLSAMAIYGSSNFLRNRPRTFKLLWIWAIASLASAAIGVALFMTIGTSFRHPVMSGLYLLFEAGQQFETSTLPLIILILSSNRDIRQLYY